MWKALALLWVLGSAWLCDPAQGAVVGLLEDDIVTQAAKDGVATPGLEDSIVTTHVVDGSYHLTDKTPLVQTSTENRAKPPIEDLPTPGIPDHSHEETQSTPTPKVVTSHPTDTKTSHPGRDEAAGEAQTTDGKDGLAIVTLVGIIVGVLLAIGFVGVIIVVVMRKISGRFSP
uniref:podoplanin isoform X1 n=1 Tax=Jaculus jaculus TaxID=51337 RepID=UPI001E1B4276|nr:podoplanin isoform X1 [Jaculus jaculus]